MQVINTYCDCCGKKLEKKNGEDEVFVIMTIGKTGDAHFCFPCAKQLLDVWWKKVGEIRGVK